MSKALLAGSSTRRGAGTARLVLAGALLGAGYAAALRAWMRLVSTDPGFSWSGTGYIIGVFVVLGAMAGLATGVRRSGGRRIVLTVRAAGILLSLGCFVAAGAAMFPTVVPGALAMSRTDWPRRVRMGLLVLALVAAVALVVTMSHVSWSRRLTALACYLPMCSIEIAMVARLYGPSLPPGTVGRRARIAVLIAVCLMLTLGVVLFTGLPG